MTPGNPQSTTEAARIAREASVWFVQREQGLSPSQVDAFAQWCAADPRHGAALEQATRAHELLLDLPQSPAAAKLLVELDALTRRKPDRLRAPVLQFFSRRTFATIAAAAAGLALLVGAWSMVRTPPSDRYATTTAMRRAIALSDGSTLSLSEQSAVRVDFRTTERRLQLEHGEARFAVAKDAHRPFRVFAGSVLVQAVGTEFTVQRTSDAVEVTVTEGSVAVSRTDEESQGINPTGTTFALAAGERVVLDLRPAAPASAATTLAGTHPDSTARSWPAPRLVFRDTPLAEVVERFNRFNRVQLVVADPRLAARLVGGSFDADNAEAFVKLLHDSGAIAVERVSDTRLELRSAP